MLNIFSSAPLYTRHVRQPKAQDHVPSKIRRNPKFYPYFKDAVGALDGSHIHSAPQASERAFHRNRKGFLSQNCLFGCSFDLKFIYSLTGWEGATTDARLFEDATTHDLHIPPGKYFLGDGGFPAHPSLLIPYRHERYHLAEWGRSRLR
jgi:DDE superfamily endonuclease